MLLLFLLAHQKGSDTLTAPESTGDFLSNCSLVYLVGSGWLNVWCNIWFICFISWFIYTEHIWIWQKRHFVPKYLMYISDLSHPNGKEHTENICEGRTKCDLNVIGFKCWQFSWCQFSQGATALGFLLVQRGNIGQMPPLCVKPWDITVFN